jgi:hypothetical protein
MGLNTKGAEGPFHAILNQLTRLNKLTRLSNLTRLNEKRGRRPRSYNIKSADTTKLTDATEQSHKRRLNKKGAEGPFHTISKQLTRLNKPTRLNNLTKGGLNKTKGRRPLSYNTKPADTTKQTDRAKQTDQLNVCSIVWLLTSWRVSLFSRVSWFNIVWKGSSAPFCH